MAPVRVAELPREIEDITPRWISSLLPDRFAGNPVIAVRPEPLHLGTASTWRLHLQFEQAVPAPSSTLCIKSDFGLPHRENLARTGLYRKEARVFLDILTRTSTRTPSCLAGGYDETGRGFMLMEDIAAAGGSFCQPASPLSVDQVAIGVEQLALLHAATWEAPFLTEREWRHHDVPLESQDPFWNAIFDRYDDLLENPHASAMAKVFRDGETVRHAFNRLRVVDDSVAHCLIHGDAHIGNFYLDRDGRTGMVDFQCVQRGHPTHDLSLFIGSALDVEDRRVHERDLIRHYLDCLSRSDIAIPGFDEIWLGYRQHFIYGLFVWLSTTDRFQPQISLVTNVFRYGIAALDHKSIEALR